MHGILENLKEYLPVGETLTGLGIGEFQVQFHFEKHNISVESSWTLHDAIGKAVDSNKRSQKMTKTSLPVLLGKTVKNFSLQLPQSFSLVFEDGHKLTIFDDSDKYESFSIQPGNVFV